MNDQLIEKHLKHLAHSPHNASVKHFLETGKISGSFYLALIELINEAERNGAVEYQIYDSNRKDDYDTPVIRHFQDESEQEDMQNMPHFRD
jgi:hypothetical protein